MLNDILQWAEKIGRVFSTFKIGMIIGAFVNLLIIIILFKLTDIFIRKLQSRIQATNENAESLKRIFSILDKIIKFLIVFIIVASFLQSHGYSLTSLIAGFGITGLAVGFAAQSTIAAMFGTLGILSDKVFKIGDYIRINNMEGTVESISLRSTKIRSLENFLVTIPNDVVANNIVENITRAHKRRIDITVGITYDTGDEKIERALEILKYVAEVHPDVYSDYIANVSELDSSSINLRLIAYAKTRVYSEFVRIKGEVLQDIIKQFRAENIEFAFTSQTVYMGK